jgi:hypothetical protein
MAAREIVVNINGVDRKFDLNQKTLEQLAQFIGYKYPRMIETGLRIQKEDYYLLNAHLKLVDLSASFLAELKEVAKKKDTPVNTSGWAVQISLKNEFWEFKLISVRVPVVS